MQMSNMSEVDVRGSENKLFICKPSHQNRALVGWMHFKILVHLCGKKQRKYRGGSRYEPIRPRPPPFWQLNHANSGYFGAISANFPSILTLGPLFFANPGSGPEIKKKLRSIFDHKIAVLHPIYTWEISTFFFRWKENHNFLCKRQVLCFVVTGHICTWYEQCPKLTLARSPVACKFIVGRVEITNVHARLASKILRTISNHG